MKADIVETKSYVMKVSIEDFSDEYTFDKTRDLLGSGAFGSTYSAYCKTLKTQVAIKFYHIEEKRINSIEQEIQHAIKLSNHDNLIRYHYFFTVDHGSHKERAVIMELANSGNLATYRRTIASDEGAIREVLVDILRGLAYLEEKNIVHRDIKLENILMHRNENGRMIAKIADLGLAKSYADDLFNKHSDSYTTMSGTPAYMAPELINKRYAVVNESGTPILKNNADLWSFGVLAYYLFNAEPPFGSLSDGTPLMRLMDRIISEEVPPEKLQRVTPPFRQVIERCLVKKAVDRVDSARELLKIMERTRIVIPSNTSKIIVKPKKA